MDHVFHRHTQIQYPIAVRGDGCYLIDENNVRHLDGCCGAAVSCVGHSNERVRNAIKEQTDKLAFAHSGFFTTEPMEELADFLCAKAPGVLDRVYFVSGGSEAVEGAIKMARQYFLEIGKPEKSKIIARWQSYHGNTLGALSAGGNKWRREQFKPMLIDMGHISACYEYRGKEDGESSQDYGLRVANELEEMIIAMGPENVAAFIAEPVVGATMGCVPATDGYFKRIREICNQYEVLLILDEVMCGMGRTGTLFAHESENITADLVTIAKGLGGGYGPIGAIMVEQKIYDAIASGSGFFQHGHTYMGHALACAASLAVQKEIEDHNLLDNVQTRGKQLFDELLKTLGEHPHIGDIRGRGLFIGLELVKDRETKEPFEASEQIQHKIKAAAMKDGLMVYAMPGTIDGKRGGHLMLAPPFIIDDSQVDEITSKLHNAIKTIVS